MAESKPTPREPYFWIFVIALVLRVVLIFFGHTYKFYDHNHNFSFGWEMGSIGRSLAAGEGFSSPFGAPTGPTAWEPPLYPYLIAGVFKVFGIYSLASAVVLLAINSVFSALTCIPIFWIARRSFGERVALWTCWMWALLPPIMTWATRWVWETSLAAFLLTWLFWLTLVMEDGELSFSPSESVQESPTNQGYRGLFPWALFGLLWGIAALVNTSLLSFLPVSGLWICWRSFNQRGDAPEQTEQCPGEKPSVPWFVGDSCTDSEGLKDNSPSSITSVSQKSQVSRNAARLCSQTHRVAHVIIGGSNAHIQQVHKATLSPKLRLAIQKIAMQVSAEKTLLIASKTTADARE